MEKFKKTYLRGAENGSGTQLDLGSNTGFAYAGWETPVEGVC